MNAGGGGGGDDGWASGVQTQYCEIMLNKRTPPVIIIVCVYVFGSQ